MRDARKIVALALAGAIGCLAAAVAGEVWLALTRQPPGATVSARDIALVLDTSGSMGGLPLEELKTSAAEFVRQADFAGERLAVIAFSDEAEIVCQPSTEKSSLCSAIAGLEAGGATNLGAGLDLAERVLAPDKQRHVLLFSDGMPNIPRDAERSARNGRALGIQIVAIATGDADEQFLSRITGDPALVFRASTGNFRRAFQEASVAIRRNQLVESEGSGGNLVVQVGRLAVWTALLGCGLALALVCGQNWYFGRPLLAGRHARTAALGGAAAGLVAGVLIQAIFGAATGLPRPAIEIGRLLGWTGLGALVGGMTALFVPNLRVPRGAAGGALGGVLGGVLFLCAALALGDVLGRLLGAAALGLLIGAMIAVAEVAARRFWLEVVYGPKETRSITLGAQAVAVGSDKEQCQVLVPGTAGVALRYAYQSHQITLDDLLAGRSQTVFAGDVRTVGKLKLIIRQAAAAEAASGSPAPATAGAQKEKRSGESAASSPLSPVAAAPGPVPPGAGATGFFLRASGRFIPLIEHARLTAADLGLRSTLPPGQACAEVIRHPSSPDVFGLKNLTVIVWQATPVSGETKAVEPGKSVRLAKGTSISAGGTALHIE